MKIDPSTTQASWTAGAARNFADSPLGREVLTQLREGSRSKRALSDFVLRDPVFVATHGIEDVSRISGISPSTISRYVRDLGLDNYAAFRAGVADTVHALIAPVTKLESRLAEGDAGASPIAASFMAAASQIEALGHPATAEAVQAATKMLREARQVWVMGFGLSAHLAAILALGLQPYRDGIVNVVQYGGTEVAAGRLMSAGDGDLVVAISFPRYSKDVTDLARISRSMGAKLIALTDSPAAPLAQVSDHLLLAPAQHPILSSSCLPGLATIEALLSDFLLSDPIHVKRAGRLAAIMSAYLADDTDQK
jgi:DNA-binding MurR/RpiR family transcriptional regulator